jgi:arylsulfatase A-like enzyme
LFTGNYPNQYRRLLKKGQRTDSFFHIQQQERLLTEALVEEGYDAQCWIENGVARRAHALQGFTKRDGERIRKEIVPALTEKVGFQPLNPRYLQLVWGLDFLLSKPQNNFFFLHWINDPHAEYRPPRPHREREGLTMEGFPQSPQFYLGLGHHNRPKNNQRKLREHAPTLSAPELDLLKRLYLMEVESMDERVGYLLKALEVGGLVEKTLVIFTSDHGEGFGEHGRFLHGDSLYNELVHVPLIFAGPGVAGGRRVASPVSHVDIVPTITDFLQLEGFDDLQGRSLKALLSGELQEDTRRVHYLASPDRLESDALVSGNFKLIASLEEDRVELYDLAADPGESHNRAEELPKIVARMRNSLHRIRQENDHRWKLRLGRDNKQALEETQLETRKQLQAVGYLD